MESTSNKRKYYAWFKKLGFHFLDRLCLNSFLIYRNQKRPNGNGGPSSGPNPNDGAVAGSSSGPNPNDGALAGPSSGPNPNDGAVAGPSSAPDGAPPTAPTTGAGKKKADYLMAFQKAVAEGLLCKYAPEAKKLIEANKARLADLQKNRTPRLPRGDAPPQAQGRGPPVFMVTPPQWGADEIAVSGRRTRRAVRSRPPPNTIAPPPCRSC